MEEKKNDGEEEVAEEEAKRARMGGSRTEAEYVSGPHRCILGDAPRPRHSVTRSGGDVLATHVSTFSSSSSVFSSSSTSESSSFVVRQLARFFVVRRRSPVP